MGAIFACGKQGVTLSATLMIESSSVLSENILRKRLRRLVIFLIERFPWPQLTLNQE